MRVPALFLLATEAAMVPVIAMTAMSVTAAVAMELRLGGRHGRPERQESEQGEQGFAKPQSDQPPWM